MATDPGVRINTPAAPQGWELVDCRGGARARFRGPGGKRVTYHWALWCENIGGRQHIVRGEPCVVIGSDKHGWCISPLSVQSEDKFSDMPWFDTPEEAVLHLLMLSEGF